MKPKRSLWQNVKGLEQQIYASQENITQPLVVMVKTFRWSELQSWQKPMYPKCTLYQCSENIRDTTENTSLSAMANPSGPGRDLVVYLMSLSHTPGFFRKKSSLWKCMHGFVFIDYHIKIQLKLVNWKKLGCSNCLFWVLVLPSYQGGIYCAAFFIHTLY